MTQKTYRVFEHFYTPILIGARKRYRIELPLGASPRLYKTMTTDMQSWYGEVLEAASGQATALISPTGSPIVGTMVGPVQKGDPCVVMEHINIDGELEYMIGDKDILNGNVNFINFGIPGGRHLRIDLYTGESKVIDGN